MKFDEQILNNFFETELNTTKGVVKSMPYGRSRSEIDDLTHIFIWRMMKKYFFFKLQSVMDEQGQMRDKDGLYASAIYMVEHN